MNAIHQVYSEIEELAEIPPASVVIQGVRYWNNLGPNGEEPKYPKSAKAAELKEAIDEAANEILRIFKVRGLKVNGSDPIERVVEAIAKFAVESGNEII